ncbi:MAG: hypothetical protein DRG78_10565, partial [Epsilonproteobacteria bacterium]
MKKIILLLSLFAFLYASEESNSTKETGFFNFDKRLFVSEEDGKFDISDFLSTKYGCMPVPMIVREPAIGDGGGL